jgi:hypothetical protein
MSSRLAAMSRGSAIDSATSKIRGHSASYLTSVVDQRYRRPAWQRWLVRPARNAARFRVDGAARRPTSDRGGGGYGNSPDTSSSRRTQDRRHALAGKSAAYNQKPARRSPAPTSSARTSGAISQSRLRERRRPVRRSRNWPPGRKRPKVQSVAAGCRGQAR